jgi:hypothetical protein
MSHSFTSRLQWFKRSTQHPTCKANIAQRVIYSRSQMQSRAELVGLKDRSDCCNDVQARVNVDE